MKKGMEYIENLEFAENHSRDWAYICGYEYAKAMMEGNKENANYVDSHFLTIKEMLLTKGRNDSDLYERFFEGENRACGYDEEEWDDGDYLNRVC